MKRFTTLLTCTSMLFSLTAQTIWNGSIDTNWAGQGTVNNPYLISSAAELAGMAEVTANGNSLKDKYFLLTNDILLNDTTNWQNWTPTNHPANYWKPIGTDTTALDAKFEGHFNGGNHTISGLYFCDTIDAYLSGGLFDEISYATIENVHMKATYVYTAGWSAGAVVGLGGGSSQVRNCTADAIISGQDYLGGIIGVAIYGSVHNCHSSGKIISAQGRVGGIAGDIDIVTDCSSSMDIFCEEGESVGGLVGTVGEVSNCYASGKVIGNKKVGGLVGELSSTLYQKVYNSYATGDVIGSAYVGGFAGEANTDSIYNCYATGNVSSEGGYYVGGFIGGITFIENGLYSMCYASGNVVALPNQFGDKAEQVGGFVGYIEYGSGATFSQCYAANHVVGKKMVGGFIGNMSGPALQDCYSDGTVKGEEKVGGLVGNLRSNTITNCYAIGSVTGTTTVNGLVGYYHNDDSSLSALISNSYYGATNVPWTTHERSFEQMQDIDTYIGWDFKKVWTIDSINDGEPKIHRGLPYLRNLQLKEPGTVPTTGVTTIPVIQENKVQKIYRNGQIYILRGKEMYSITGQRVK